MCLPSWPQHALDITTATRWYCTCTSKRWDVPLGRASARDVHSSLQGTKLSVFDSCGDYRRDCPAFRSLRARTYITCLASHRDHANLAAASLRRIECFGVDRGDNMQRDASHNFLPVAYWTLARHHRYCAHLVYGCDDLPALRSEAHVRRIVCTESQARTPLRYVPLLAVGRANHRWQ